MKCAVIGVGNMGRHHARNYFEIKGWQLVAIADQNSSLGKELAKKYHCRFYKDYREMLKREKFEAVSIATPTSTHYPVATDCIRAKKHVLIEKPIASSLNEAKNLIKKAQKNQVKLTVGHIERFNPAIKKLKLMIDQGKFGKIKSLIFQRVGLIPLQIKDANVIIDIGIHDIDLANFLLNAIPQKIIAFGGKVLTNHQEDHADILLKYSSGVAHIQINWITPTKIRRLMITGTKGYAEIDYIDQKLIFYRHHYAQTYDNYGDFVIKFGRESKKRNILIKKSEPLKEELKSFLKSIRSDKEPEVTGKEALLALKIALKISKIIKKGNKDKKKH